VRVQQYRWQNSGVDPGDAGHQWPEARGGGACPPTIEEERAMSSDVDELLAEINSEQREFNQTIWPPASAPAIVRLRALARDVLQADLPEDYVAFLGRNDGLDFNGYVIYGATEHREPFLSGFVEANQRLGGPQARHVYYGDTGDHLYAQDRVSLAWVALDRPSLSVIDTFLSFAAMLTKVLRDAVVE
jgi:hypothetical protein